ncbi:MAG: efflux RND transporter periplasmic adaptor subunit [Spirochaetaceae bacterium]|nr:MAG: efflux RND transporter periplasmic adaptor subunit [Spirochaetaceae bacterium]
MGKNIWMTVRRFRVVLAVFMMSALPILFAIVPGSDAAGTPDAAETRKNLEAPRNTTEKSAPVVSVVTLTPQSLVEYLETTAEIRPAASIEVYPQASGVVAEMKVRVGSRVEREEVLGTVDQSLPGRPYLPSPIRAPMSGTVVSEIPQVGTQVSQQTPVMRIATTHNLEIVTHIPERYIGQISIGSRALVIIEAYPNCDPAPARIRELSPTLDPRSRTLDAILEFDSPKTLPAGVRPGMFARLRLVTSESPRALVVPQPAVLRRDSGPAVYVVNRESGVAELRPVKLGIETNGQAELVGGVEAGETVVIRGQNTLRDNTAVRVVEQDHLAQGGN